jgi:hypothetical protein
MVIFTTGIIIKRKINNMKNTDKNWMDMRSRFRILAGIIKKDTLATLTIPNGSTIIELKTLPTWFEKLKYKLCGFECKIVRNSPVNDNSINEEDIDKLVTELEAEAK